MADDLLARGIEAWQVTIRALTVAVSLLRPRRPLRPATARHLVIVSWHFPPDLNTGAQLPAFLARQAARDGWRVTVLCAPALTRPSGPGVDASKLVPETVRIVRARGWFDESLEYHPQLPYRLSPRVDGGYAQMVSMTSTAFDVLAGDPPTHVFATGPAFGNFLAAARIARRFGAPLCLQYRDEWTALRPSFVAEIRGDRARERDCLARADLVTFVTEGKASLYRQEFSELSGIPVVVTPNGWDPDIVALADAQPTRLGHLRGRHVLAFTGNVTPASPMIPFLDTLSEVLDADPAWRMSFTLLVVGHQSPETTERLEQFANRFPACLELQPPVEQAGAFKMMREATMLLLLNNTRYSGVVPIKTFDYMRSGTPILAFGESGGAGNCVTETGAGVTVPEGQNSALGVALRELSATDPGKYRTPARAAWCEKHNRATLFGELLAQIGALQRPGTARGDMHRSVARVIRR